MRGGLVGILYCALDEECRDMKALMRQLGSRGANLITWTAEELERALFSTYPHQPTPVDPGLLVLSMGLSNTPIIGDLYDLYTGVTGYDPVTKQYLAGWERLANIAGAIPLLGLSGANIRHGVHAAESLMDSGDELAQFIGKACSFDEDTPVATSEGSIPIGEIDVGNRVLAWDEEIGSTGYYTVTALWRHEDPVTVQLVINGETIDTTPEHPFYELENVPWSDIGATQGRWTPAGDLKAGDQIRKADGTTGVVQTVVFEATPQIMYNLTVADVHTFFVGDGKWLVHNVCLLTGSSYLSEARSGISHRLQDSIVSAIHEHGDSRLLAAFRGSEPGSYIWHGSVRAKPMGASNLWEGTAGLRFGKIPGGTMGYYVSDLDGAWVLDGAGARINDGQLLDEESGLYSAINKLYNVDIIQHGAHMNYILDGLKGEPLSSQRLGKALSYLSDQVYIFGYNGYVGSGSMRNTFYQYFIPR